VIAILWRQSGEFNPRGEFHLRPATGPRWSRKRSGSPEPAAAPHRSPRRKPRSNLRNPGFESRPA